MKRFVFCFFFYRSHFSGDVTTGQAAFDSIPSRIANITNTARATVVTRMSNFQVSSDTLHLRVLLSAVQP